MLGISCDSYHRVLMNLEDTNKKKNQIRNQENKQKFNKLLFLINLFEYLFKLRKKAKFKQLLNLNRIKRSRRTNFFHRFHRGLFFCPILNTPINIIDEKEEEEEWEEMFLQSLKKHHVLPLKN